VDVFSTAFLPPPVFVSALLRAEEAVIDIHERFVKQTHRNRCRILTSNGPLALVIPVQHSETKIVKDIRISYAENWRRKYTQAIVSAYRNSPYYEHYEEDFMAVFNREQTFLYDYNESLWQWIWKVLDVQPVYKFSGSYMENSATGHRGTDYCNDETLPPAKPYKQVFSYKSGFVPHMSIIDLVFNKGPEAGGIQFKMKN